MTSVTLKDACAVSARNEAVVGERATGKSRAATRALGKEQQSFRADWNALLGVPKQTAGDELHGARAVNPADLLLELQHATTAFGSPQPPNSVHPDHQKDSSRSPEKGIGKGRPKAIPTVSTDPAAGAIIASIAAPHPAGASQHVPAYAMDKAERRTLLAKLTVDQVPSQVVGAPSARSTRIHNRSRQSLREQVDEGTELESAADTAPQPNKSLSARESGEQLQIAPSETDARATAQAVPPHQASSTPATLREGLTTSSPM